MQSDTLPISFPSTRRRHWRSTLITWSASLFIALTSWAHPSHIRPPSLHHTIFTSPSSPGPRPYWLMITPSYIIIHQGPNYVHIEDSHLHNVSCSPSTVLSPAPLVIRLCDGTATILHMLRCQMARPPPLTALGVVGAQSAHR